MRYYGTSAYSNMSTNLTLFCIVKVKVMELYLHIITIQIMIIFYSIYYVFFEESSPNPGIAFNSLYCYKVGLFRYGNWLWNKCLGIVSNTWRDTNSGYNGTRAERPVPPRGCRWETLGLLRATRPGWPSGELLSMSVCVVLSCPPPGGLR